MGSCVYHSKRWRGEVQRLLNSVRGGLLSEQHVKYFPKAVCTCKGGPPQVIEDLSLSDLETWVKGISADNGDLKNVYPCLLVFLKAAQSNTTFSPSDPFLRVIFIIKSATEGDYSTLTPPGSPHSSKPLPPSFNFILPLSSTFLGVFLGSKGTHIKPLCAKFNVKINFQEVNSPPFAGQLKTEKSVLTGDSVQVTIVGRVGEKVDFPSIKEWLISRAESIKRKRLEHLENVATYVKFQSSHTMGVRALYQQRPYISSPKEAATEQFARKHHRSSKTSPVAKKLPHSVLMEGHCLHCLATFQPTCTVDGACSYHIGYLVPLKQPIEGKRSKWSCCELTTVEQHPSHIMHSFSGCMKDHHIWRPGKPSNRDQAGAKEPSGKNPSDFMIT